MHIDLHLLDVVAGSEEIYSYAIGMFLIIVIGIILVEAVAMLLLGYSSFGKALLDSLVINIVSMVAGYFMAENMNISSMAGYNGLRELLYYLIATIIIETLVLWLLNRKKPFSKTLVAGLVINFASYVLIYLFFYR
ncbi:MAG TPA: hypothetical protein PKC69_03945 [Chitinophagaceae bacterium]|nr:hypothetical protein [Chitinophagaceae bacterium]